MTATTTLRDDDFIQTERGPVVVLDHIVERHLAELMVAIRTDHWLSDDGLDYLNAASDLYQEVVQALSMAVGGVPMTADDLRVVHPCYSAWDSDVAVQEDAFKFMREEGRLTEEVWQEVEQEKDCQEMRAEWAQDEKEDANV